jgi:ribosomal protein S12 methylthiotransferase accessory factor
MMKLFVKAYTAGTHRLVTPEETFERIKPHLKVAGITRCANITGLDHLNIPVYCAIRPQGLTLQVSNGKGLEHSAAQVSALMEAIEVYHAEHPGTNLHQTSLAALQNEGKLVIRLELLPGYQAIQYFSPNFIIDWVCGENLKTGETIWLPASAVYLCRPSLYPFSTNGLASGNHLLEATLHGLYEVIERDAISRLSINGRLQITQHSHTIDLNTIDDKLVRQLYETLESAGVKLVLLWVPSCIPIHTFWAVILDRNHFSYSSMVNIGYGSHLNPSVAASRAITEAAQSRLTYIHAAREDLKAQAYQGSKSHTKLFTFFDQLVGNKDWRTFIDMSETTLEQDYAKVIDSLSSAGYEHILRVVLTRAPFHIPVVKVFVCGLEMNHRFF